MSDNSIIHYIQKSLSKGYNPEQIRNALINAGHNPYEVDILLTKAIQKKPSHKLIIITIATIIMTIIIISIMLLMTQEEQSPSISITTPQDEITKGDSIIINTQMINPSEKRINAVLDYMVFSEQGSMITSKRKTVTITDYSTQVPEQIRLDLPPGNYKLILTATLGTYVLTKELYLKITVPLTKEQPSAIETPTEQRIEQKKECIGGCDDYNACTKDYCEEGECKHDAIIPCCGNGKCEEGESESCVDCIKQKTEEKEEKEMPATAEQALKECQKIATLIERDRCLDEISEQYQISKICGEISDEIKKDSCYMGFALDGDYAVCDKISNKYTRNSCNNLRMMSS